MTEGPTTINGPLHTPNVALEDRLISATFANSEAAHAAKQKLVGAGVPEGSVLIGSHADRDQGVAKSTEPSDQNLIGRIREAIVPEDSERQGRAAVANDDALLEVRPPADLVETVVRIIEQSAPTRFDADLERWRNKT